MTTAVATASEMKFQYTNIVDAPSRHRSVARMLMRGLNVKTIAERTGMHESTVKKVKAHKVIQDHVEGMKEDADIIRREHRHEFDGMLALAVKEEVKILRGNIHCHKCDCWWHDDSPKSPCPLCKGTEITNRTVFRPIPPLTLQRAIESIFDRHPDASFVKQSKTESKKTHHIVDSVALARLREKAHNLTRDDTVDAEFNVITGPDGPTQTATPAHGDSGEEDVRGAVPPESPELTAPQIQHEGATSE